VQAVAIPVSGDQVEYVEGVAARLRAHGIRVEVDAGDDRMQKKIRTHTLQKVPFLLLAGAPRRRGGRGQLPVPRRHAGQRACRWTRRLA
jgi:threonyl-tRNA synthetase